MAFVLALAACVGRAVVGSAGSTDSVPQVASLPGAGLIDPRQCSGFGLSPRRCRAVARAAAAQAGLVISQVHAIELIAPPTPEPGVINSGSGFALVARIRLVNGTETITNVGICGGIGLVRTPLCTENPVVYVMSPTINGYRDIPCSDENGGGCATPLPAIDPKSAGAAVPLRLASQDVTIDHIGKYEVPLGYVTLPNGILSHAAALLGDDHPKAFIVTDGVVWISLKSRDGSRPPFENYYDHGWWPGTEQADVTLAFGIEEFEPGAILQIRNLVVE